MCVVIWTGGGQRSVIIVGPQELSVLVFEAGFLAVPGAHRLG